LHANHRGYYGTPLWGDQAIVKVKPGAAVPEMLTAGLFDENWQLPKSPAGPHVRALSKCQRSNRSPSGSGAA
jgi:hypothetical protein